MRTLHFSADEIIETIEMVQVERLDIRTITMGISLFDCVSEDVGRLCDNLYRKITTKAADLTRVSREIGQEFGVPIINNRIAVTSVAWIAGAASGSR